MSYSKDVQGSTTVFNVQPERVPVPWGLVAVAAVPVTIFLFINVVAALFVAALFAALVWARMRIFPAARKFRAPATFSVSPDGVKLGGAAIRRPDIHRAVIRNHVLGGAQGSDFITLHQGVGAMVGATGAAANAKFRGQLEAISYRVDVEAGGVPTTLAGGLTEPAAFAILADVSSILELDVSH